MAQATNHKVEDFKVSDAIGKSELLGCVFIIINSFNFLL